MEDTEKIIEIESSDDTIEDTQRLIPPQHQLLFAEKAEEIIDYLNFKPEGSTQKLSISLQYCALQELIFRGVTNNFFDTNWSRFYTSLLEFDKIKKLDLSDNKIGEHVEGLAAYIVKSTSITTLRLEDNNIHYRVPLIANSLKINSSLTSLNLSGNNISDVGASNLARALTKNYGLVKLNLSRNNISSTATMIFADSLRINSTLRVLVLDSNRVGTSGARKLADSLQHNFTINEIHLRKNKIAYKGLVACYDAMAKNYSVHLIDIEGNPGSLKILCRDFKRLQLVNKIKRLNEPKSKNQSDVNIKYENESTTEPVHSKEKQHKDPDQEYGRILQYSELNIDKHELGKGNFGRVLKGTYRGAPVAIKMLTKKNYGGKGYEVLVGSEIKNLCQLDHPYIVRYFGICIENSQVNLVFEYLPKGSLSKNLPVLTQYQQLFISCEIACGMQYIHDQEIIHKDLKPENVLLTTDLEVRIADFGLSEIESYDEGSEVLGDRRYVPKEIQENPKKFRKRADVYSYGIVVWQIYSKTDNEFPKVKINNTKIPAPKKEDNKQDNEKNDVNDNEEKETLQPKNCPHEIFQIISDCLQYKKPLKFKEICDKTEEIKRKFKDNNLLLSMTAEDVCKWAKTLDLEHDYSELFLKRSINGRVLKDMMNQPLSWNDLKITSTKDLLALQNGIQQLS